MYHNFTYRNSTEALVPLLQALAEADEVGSRNGRVRELTHVGITLQEPLEREILTPRRRANLAAQIAETAWVLAGRDDIDWLGNYLPRAAQFSDDGKTWRGAYGRRMRRWPVRDGEDATVVDQLASVVDLLRNDALTRRAVINLFDPQIDHSSGKDIPCNNWLSFTSRLGRLDLHVAVRSNDIMWGWSGINAFEWSVLQEIVAGMLGISVGALHFSTTSFHLYETHWQRADRISDTAPDSRRRRVVHPSPRFDWGAVRAAYGSSSVEALDDLLADWFAIEETIRTGGDATAAVDAFPEPMFRSWLRVLQWWWSGGEWGPLGPLLGTRLSDAAKFAALQPKPVEPPVGDTATTEEIKNFAGDTVREIVHNTDFAAKAMVTHREKDAAYGDSWKRRGEMLGILANIARKIDRLGSADTSDETSVDTALDLLVYLAKYRTWLSDNGLGHPLDGGPSNGTLSDTPDAANDLISQLDVDVMPVAYAERKSLEDTLRDNFNRLEQVVTANGVRYLIVDTMAEDAYRLARLLHDHAEWKSKNETRRWKGYEN